MRGLLFATSCVLAASASLEEAQKIIQDCRSGKVEECKKVQAKRHGLTDNSYCASFDLNKYDFKTNWEPLCTIANTCDTKEPDQGFVYSLNGQLTQNDVDDIINSFSRDLYDRIGRGLRRKLMDPSYSGPLACRSWIQLKDDEGTRSYFADAFSYHQKEVNGEKLHYCKFYGKVHKTLKAVEQETADSVGIWGDRYCGCEYSRFNLDCKPMKKDDPIVAACRKDPSSEECKKVDSLTLAATADACMVGTDAVGACYKSDKLPSTCYHTDGAFPKPSGEDQLVLSLPADVRDFLVKAGSGNFYEFAAFVGFSESDPDFKNLNYRPKTIIPEYAGAVACRNLINLRGSLGQYAINRADTFVYEPNTKSCRFYYAASSAKRNLNEVAGGDDAIVFGDDYCL